MLINVPAVESGDANDENLYNSRFSKIVNVINGNLDAENLASNAVTTPKIADNNVTTSKVADEAIVPAKWTNPYKFMVHRSVNYTASNNSNVQFNAKSFDDNDDFDTTTHTYTAPVDGYYQFNWRVGHNVNNGTGYYSALRVNGTLRIRGSSFISAHTNSGMWGGTSGGGIIQLEAGDAITVRWTGVANGTVAGDAAGEGTFFSGFLVSLT